MTLSPVTHFYAGYVNIMARDTGQFMCVQLPSLTIVNYSVWLGDDLDAVIMKTFELVSNDLINVQLPLTEELRIKYSKMLDSTFTGDMPVSAAAIRKGCIDNVLTWKKVIN